MDDQREMYVNQIKEEMGIKLTDPIPTDRRLEAREKLVCLLESGEDICSRDVIRIAHAWVNDKKMPKNWRRG